MSNSSSDKTYGALSEQLNVMTGSLSRLIQNHKEFKESFEGGRIEQISNEVQNINVALNKSSETDAVSSQKPYN